MASGGFDWPEVEAAPEGVQGTAGPQGCLLGFLIPLLGLVLVALGTALVSAVQWPTQAAATPKPPQQAQVAPQPQGAAEAAARLAPFFTPEVQYWAPLIRRWSEDYGLDPNLIATVMQIESCGDPQALSRSGARGLFQVMPFHFRPHEDPFQPDTNARRGLTYLRQALQRAQGDVRLALAMYNGGPGVLTWPMAYWPAETQRYVGWGVGIYADAQAGKSTSPTLARWLAAGGASLCQRAHRRLGLP
ncbi:MAG TPA: lytic transglycosylase domain-containing protein [Anaerolineae bacterium]|nr:lytic transglycosylase domain-containing protein [Anaerolineae bacterium]HID84179.1 lytic transglycosylase domain-containing protein [Anaerolineales bacterium]HIQ09211.1 lytic transglycosylase domain-containing protein [Anaerolineaceae bacterium]